MKQLAVEDNVVEVRTKSDEQAVGSYLIFQVLGIVGLLGQTVDAGGVFGVQAIWSSAATHLTVLL